MACQLSFYRHVNFTIKCTNYSKQVHEIEVYAVTVSVNIKTVTRPSKDIYILQSFADFQSRSKSDLVDKHIKKSD